MATSHRPGPAARRWPLSVLIVAFGCSDPAASPPLVIPDIAVFPGSAHSEAGVADAASVPEAFVEAGAVDASAWAREAGVDAANPLDASTSAWLETSPATSTTNPDANTSPDPFCGDGVLDVGEECDDGNWLVTDGCVHCIIVPVCGNQHVEFNEQCDDGNSVATDGCAGCVIVPLCGNGTIEVGEECDSPDVGACNRCRLPRTHVCGNGIVDVGEECDSTSEACVACRLIAPVCGDGITNSDEQCDDGNDYDNDGCDHLCRTRQCGDGLVQDGEHCDPPGGACRTDCTLLPPNCGDGVLQQNERERCDDGNVTRGDGCHECNVECGNGLVEPDLGELCEPKAATHSCLASVSPECVPCSGGDCEVRDVCSSECRPQPSCSLRGVLDTDAGASASPDMLDCTREAPVVPCASPNRLANATFDASTAGWSSADPRVTLTHTTYDGFGAPGAMLVILDNGEPGGVTETQGARTCVPVTDEAQYTFGGAYRFLDSTWQSSGVSVSLLMYASSDCSGPAIHAEVSRGPKAPQDTEWTGYTFTVNTDATSGELVASILVKLDVWRSPQASSISALWDDVSLMAAPATCAESADAGP